MNKITVKLKTELCKHLDKHTNVKINDINGIYLGDDLFIFFTNKLPIKGMIAWASLEGYLFQHLERHVDKNDTSFNVIVNDFNFYYELI